MTTPDPSPDPTTTPLTAPPQRVGWIPPQEYADLLGSYACIEDRFALQAQGCAVRELTWGRSDLADQWALVSVGHELQAERYRGLAPEYAA